MLVAVIKHASMGVLDESVDIDTYEKDTGGSVSDYPPPQKKKNQWDISKALQIDSDFHHLTVGVTNTGITEYEK